MSGQTTFNGLMDGLANSFNELLSSTPGAGASFLGHYQILFEVAYPIRANWPSPSEPKTELRDRLSWWITRVRTQIRGPRERHTFISSDVFADLMYSLPAKLDMTSWVADVIAGNAAIQTAQALQTMLLHTTQAIADQMACLVADLYDRAMKNRGEAPLLGFSEMQKASREMLGEAFFKLPFDDENLLRPTNRLSDEEFIELHNFNTVLTESDEEILEHSPGDVDEMVVN